MKKEIYKLIDNSMNLALEIGKLAEFKVELVKENEVNLQNASKTFNTKQKEYIDLINGLNHILYKVEVKFIINSFLN